MIDEKSERTKMPVVIQVSRSACSAMVSSIARAADDMVDLCGCA